MKKYLLLLLAIVVFSSLELVSQENDLDCGHNTLKKEIYNTHLSGKIYVNKFVSQEIQFFNYWQTGDVFLSNNEMLTDELIRYNGYNDQLLWLRKKDYQAIIVERDAVDGFVFYNQDGSTFAKFNKVHLTGFNWGNKSDLFMQELVEGNLPLYAHREVGLHNNRNELFIDHSYYLQIDGHLQKIRLNRWFLYRLLPEKKTQIRQAIRGDWFYLKEEINLIKLFEELNEK